MAEPQVHRDSRRRRPTKPRTAATASTCPACHRRIAKPAGRTMTCPHCHTTADRDLFAAATIATRTPGGGPTPGSNLPQVITHRRAGRHLPGPGVTRAAHHGRHHHHHGER